jgi:small subunit ribosomal protein S17
MTVTRNQRSKISGVVVGDKMDKTITVRVELVFKHPKYGKYVRKHTKYHAHDEKNEARMGDRVELQECRPLSKSKRFRLLTITDKATVVGGHL